YPGYDGVDFLADTERGATVTLWLGVASLLPFVGGITGLLALLVTGPKAKRAIQESRGELDGYGRIKIGTVFAVIGIVVTMMSGAIAFIRWQAQPLLADNGSGGRLCICGRRYTVQRRSGSKQV